MLWRDLLLLLLLLLLPLPPGLHWARSFGSQVADLPLDGEMAVGSHVAKEVPYGLLCREHGILVTLERTPSLCEAERGGLL